MDATFWNKFKKKSIDADGTEYIHYGTIHNLYEKLLSINIDSSKKIPFEVKTDIGVVVFNYFGIEITLKYSHNLESMIEKIPKISEYLDCFIVLKYKQDNGNDGIRLSTQMGGFTIQELDNLNKNNRMAQLYELLGVRVF